MIRYSCDLCKRDLDAEEDLRYVVKMEIFAAMNTSTDDDDSDPLEQMQDLIERQEDVADEAIGEDICQQFRFDLCPECREKFVKHPLGRENFVAAIAGFSKN
jgi:hypothetical protein